MILVEDPPRVREVEVVFGLGLPRQIEDPLDVGACDRALGRMRGHAGQPIHLALGNLADVVGQIRGFQPLAQLVALGRLLVGLAELRANLAQLFARELAPLGLADFARSAFGKCLRYLRDPDLAHQVAHQRAQPREHVLLRKQLDLLREGHRAVEGDHVGEARGVVEAIENLRRLVGNIVAQRDEFFAEALHRATRGFSLGCAVEQIGEDFRLGLLELPHVEKLAQAHAREADRDDRETRAGVGEVHDLRERSYRIQILEPRLLGVRRALRDDDQKAAAAGRLLYGRERRGPANRQRQRHTGEDHRVPDRQYRNADGHFDPLAADFDRSRLGLAHAAANARARPTAVKSGLCVARPLERSISTRARRSSSS